MAALHAPGAFAQQAGPVKSDGDWPCRQILVGRISLAAVWSGPSIEGAIWRGDAALEDLVARLAARRMPIEAAERAIEEFANASKPDKEKRLIALLAGLFETLNRERAQVIEGLTRFGHKQKELAAKIREENAAIQADAAATPQGRAQGTDPSAQNLEWDLRVFNERRQSLAYVCETPTLIEQRLFALARIIERYLD
ncbi:hypothetical protein [Methylocapsa aurea]|uniref:hypothetical protein n=1 Tax=Methylocapsa aurea TaxID=663610 RepID=UPI0005606E7B|nr:hypothetical protein [Methylocapsa aurea]